MNPQASSHWSVGELRFATLPSLPPPLLREISQTFQLRPPAGGDESSLAYPKVLRSADHIWAVRLKPSALALESRADEPYDRFVERLAEIARIALPHLDTDFFTRATLRTIRSLPLSEAMEGTRAIAKQASRFKMAMTSSKTGSSSAGHFIIQETVGLSRDFCTRHVGVYEEAVESSRLESVLESLVDELSRIDRKPDQLIELPLQFDPLSIKALGGFFPVILALDATQNPPAPVSNGGGDLKGSDPDSEAENLNEDRIRHLARKYANGSLSREDEARLEILQERILHLLPSVEQHDFERLEELAAVTRGVHERHLERMERLGLAK